MVTVILKISSGPLSTAYFPFNVQLIDILSSRREIEVTDHTDVQALFEGAGSVKLADVIALVLSRARTVGIKHEWWYHTWKRCESQGIV